MAMNKKYPSWMILILLSCLFISSTAQNTTCSTQSFSNNRVFGTCQDLPYLSSSIHWNYSSSSGSVNLAYRAKQSLTGWIAWAINPTGTSMIGCQTIVAFRHSNGSLIAYTTPILKRFPPMTQGKLSFPVSNVVAEYSNGDMIIYATIVLNNTRVNQVWQSGDSVDKDIPSSHRTSGPNVRSMGSIDFLIGQVVNSGGGINSKLRRKNIHGVLNALSWGILMPIGVMMARYVKVFKDPLWFYLHVSCQASAYILGVSGWGLGLRLGSESKGVVHTVHRNIGIALFVLATLQVFALFARPNKDHKFRIYWNVYHHSIGYSVLILSIINVFKGFTALDSYKNWRTAYEGIIVFIGIVFLGLELITWPIVIRRRRLKAFEMGSTNQESRLGEGGENQRV